MKLKEAQRYGCVLAEGRLRAVSQTVQHSITCIRLLATWRNYNWKLVTFWLWWLYCVGGAPWKPSSPFCLQTKCLVQFYHKWQTHPNIYIFKNSLALDLNEKNTLHFAHSFTTHTKHSCSPQWRLTVLGHGHWKCSLHGHLSFLVYLCPPYEQDKYCTYLIPWGEAAVQRFVPCFTGQHSAIPS